MLHRILLERMAQKKRFAAAKQYPLVKASRLVTGDMKHGKMDYSKPIAKTVVCGASGYF
jgi:hypothetical protein